MLYPVGSFDLVGVRISPFHPSAFSMFVTASIWIGVGLAVFNYFTASAPVSRFTTKCELEADTGSNGESFYTRSKCYNVRQSYSNASDVDRMHSYGEVCEADQGHITSFQLALAGWSLRSLDSNRAFLVKCEVAAVEGLGEMYKLYGVATLNQADTASGSNTLPSTDMCSLSSALILAVLGEVSLGGIAGLLQSGVPSAIPNGNHLRYPI